METRKNLLVIIAILLATSMPVIGLDYPSGHDWLYELVRVAEYRTAFINGQIPPYWGANLYGGMGSPIFLYYAPLYLFISSILVPITDSIASSAVLALIIISLGGMIFMYMLLIEVHRRYGFVNDRAIRVGLYFFAFSPYLLADKFFRNANAEYTALCMSPLAFYGVILIARKPILGTAILSIGIALTVLAHNLTALTVTASCLLIIVLSYFSQKEKLSYALGGVCIGLGMTLFFWLPALSYKSLVRTELLTVGKFYFENQFKTLGQYFGYSDFYSVGLLIPLVALIGLVIVLLDVRGNKKRHAVSSLVVLMMMGVFFVFLQMPISTPLWKTIPLLELFQFPWRMMGPLALVSTVACALIFHLTHDMYDAKHHRAVEFMVLLLCLSNALPHLSKVETLPTLITASFSTMLTSENIRKQILPTTVLDEYLPASANAMILPNAAEGRRSLVDDAEVDSSFSSARLKSKSDAKHLADAFYGQQPYIDNDTNMTINIIKNESEHVELYTSSQRAEQIHITRWYYPVWSIYIDGIVVPGYADKNGLLSVSIPDGNHMVSVSLQPPAFRRISGWISLLFSILWFAIAMVAIKQSGGNIT